MSVTLRFEVSGFQAAFNRYVRGTDRDANAAALMSSRIFMRNVIAITPPGDGAKASDRAALTKGDEKLGRKAVDRDLKILFIGVRLKNKRKEIWPNLDPIHRAAFNAGKVPGKKIRPLGPQKHVDQSKLKALTKKLYSRIGRLAAHWLAGAELVGTKGIPQWVKRHAGRGQGRLSAPGAKAFRFEAINPAVPAFIAGELDRRLVYAAQYTGKNLERQLQAVLNRRADDFNRLRA